MSDINHIRDLYQSGYKIEIYTKVAIRSVKFIKKPVLIQKP